MVYTNFFEEVHVLENDRARLAPLQPYHYALLLPIALQKSIWQFSSARVNDEADFERYFNTALEEREAGTAYPFAVFDKQSGEWAGSTRFANISFIHKKLEIGWTWYHPDFQGTGLNKACKSLLLRFGFEVLQLNRIELKTSQLNVKSQTAILKIGAVKEGILRNHMINENGQVRDTVYFSFIKEEWDKTKRNFTL